MLTFQGENVNIHTSLREKMLTFQGENVNIHPSLGRKC